jgi:hypothetical protein
MVWKRPRWEDEPAPAYPAYGNHWLPGRGTFASADVLDKNLKNVEFSLTIFEMAQYIR